MVASVRKRGHEVLERLPLAWPTWMTATRVATVIVAFGAATTTALLTAWVPGGLVERLFLLLTSIALSTRLAHWVCRAPSPAKALNRTMSAGIIHALFCGGLLAPLFIVVASRGSHHDNVFGMFLGRPGDSVRWRRRSRERTGRSGSPRAMAARPRKTFCP